MIDILCSFKNAVFNINLKHDESLTELKHAIKLNLSARGVKIKESDIKLIYGFPKKIIQGEELDTLTLEELGIFDKEYILIELNQEESNNNEQNQNVIDYSKYSIKKTRL